MQICTMTNVSHVEMCTTWQKCEPNRIGERLLKTTDTEHTTRHTNTSVTSQSMVIAINRWNSVVVLPSYQQSVGRQFPDDTSKE